MPLGSCRGLRRRKPPVALPILTCHALRAVTYEVTTGSLSAPKRSLHVSLNVCNGRHCVLDGAAKDCPSPTSPALSRLHEFGRAVSAAPTHALWQCIARWRCRPAGNGCMARRARVRALVETQSLTEIIARVPPSETATLLRPAGSWLAGTAGYDKAGEAWPHRAGDAPLCETIGTGDPGCLQVPSLAVILPTIHGLVQRGLFRTSSIFTGRGQSCSRLPGHHHDGSPTTKVSRLDLVPPASIQCFRLYPFRRGEVTRHHFHDSDLSFAILSNFLRACIAQQASQRAACAMNIQVRPAEMSRTCMSALEDCLGYLSNIGALQRSISATWVSRQGRITVPDNKYIIGLTTTPFRI